MSLVLLDEEIQGSISGRNNLERFKKNWYWSEYSGKVYFLEANSVGVVLILLTGLSSLGPSYRCGRLAFGEFKIDSWLKTISRVHCTPGRRAASGKHCVVVFFVIFRRMCYGIALIKKCIQKTLSNPNLSWSLAMW